MPNAGKFRRPADFQPDRREFRVHPVRVKTHLHTFRVVPAAVKGSQNAADLRLPLRLCRSMPVTKRPGTARSSFSARCAAPAGSRSAVCPSASALIAESRAPATQAAAAPAATKSTAFQLSGRCLFSCARIGESSGSVIRSSRFVHLFGVTCSTRMITTASTMSMYRRSSISRIFKAIMLCTSLSERSDSPRRCGNWPVRRRKTT